MMNDLNYLLTVIIPCWIPVITLELLIVAFIYNKTKDAK